MTPTYGWVGYASLDGDSVNNRRFVTCCFDGSFITLESNKRVKMSCLLNSHEIACKFANRFLFDEND